MSVEINIPPAFQAIVGGIRHIDVTGSTVGECLDALLKKHPELKPRVFSRQGKLLKGLNIYINGEAVYRNPLAKPVRDGDTIHLAYIGFGGLRPPRFWK
jgi:molybdopterin converting factor small subunit